MARVRRLRGFSLIEVLLASVLLSTCLVGYLSLGASETSHVREGRDRAVAMAIARNLANLVRNSSNRAWLQSAGQNDGSGTYRLGLCCVPQVGLALGQEQQQWIARHEAGVALLWTPNPSAGVGRLECVVTWKTRRGHARRVDLPLVV